MTFEELRERIREKVILEKGEIDRHQWGLWGIQRSAAQIQIVDQQFFMLVGEITNNVSFRTIEAVEEEISQLAKDKKISSEDEEKILSMTVGLAVSRTFVKEQWIPKVLDDLPDIEAEDEVVDTEPKKDPDITTDTGSGILILDVDSINTAQPSGAEPTGLEERQKPAEDEPKLWKSKGSKILLTSLVLLALCIGWFLLFNGGDVRQGQEELNLTLTEGMSLALDKGLHSDADVKFEAVRKIFLENQSLDTALVGQAIAKFKTAGDGFCNATKDSTMISIANEYYKHASILSNTTQIVCK